MTTHLISTRLRTATEDVRTELLSLSDRFERRSGLPHSTISRAVFGPLGDKDFIKRLRAGHGFQTDKAERFERWLRAGLELRGADFREFVDAARVAARLPKRHALEAAE